MPRLPRLLLSQSYYHVMTRGNNKNIIFRSAKDYKKIIKTFLTTDFSKEERHKRRVKQISQIEEKICK